MKTKRYPCGDGSYLTVEVADPGDWFVSEHDVQAQHSFATQREARRFAQALALSARRRGVRIFGSSRTGYRSPDFCFDVDDSDLMIEVGQYD